ncbi:MAG: hypothetical protein GC157_04845 [Frankiales bacterium]|nr:hypothetical protein [Frankiales bacterium]
MEVLRWLLIPLAATVLAVIWFAWRNRERKPADAEQGMEDMDRFRRAMERPLPPLHRRGAHEERPADPAQGGPRP